MLWAAARLMHVKMDVHIPLFSVHLTGNKINGRYTDRGRECVDRSRPSHYKLIARCIDRLIDAPFFWNIAVFIIPTSVWRPRRGWPRRNFANILIHTKLEWMGYRVAKKAWRYVQPFWYSASVWRMDRRTDGQTDGRPAYIYYVRASA